MIAMMLVVAGPLAAPGVRAQTFEKHVVVAQEGNAADVGRDVLRAGGNAVDAAVATAFALAVTHPAAGNIGGGGFLVAYLADRREVVTIDFRETAPAAATARMYLGDDGRLAPNHRAGAWAAGVPGTVRGLGLAHAKWGKIGWSNLVRPAADLARRGFALSAPLADSLNAQLSPRRQINAESAKKNDLTDVIHRLAQFPESVAAFGKPGGGPWRAGDILLQRDLAETLDRIAELGPDEFYRGRTAELLARYMADQRGIITRDDLARYEAKIRPPIHSRYREHDVYGMGPPASGGIVVAEMLSILERFDLKADGPGSPRTIHRVTEAMRRAFFVRATEIADPDFVSVPVDRLISRSYADELARTITERATPSASLAPFRVLAPEPMHTTHLSAMDAAGNAVALTYTLEEGFGAKAVVKGAGFLLNNEMGDFNLIPGRTDTSGRIGTPANIIAPGKRMLSSQSPTIVLKGGQVRLVTGSPGGRTIPNTTLWVVLNVLEFDRPPQEAVGAARTHHAWFPDVLTMERSNWPEATLADLRARGHRVRIGVTQGDAHTIVVDGESGRRIGAPDPRRGTAKASGD
jgi:gamma-glutamyltranspeptidase/glutathione hydrolase